jgi:hypothetical protein
MSELSERTIGTQIGQALRLVLVEGLHAEVPVAQFGEKFAERCKNVWWTVYILDRTLSSAVGAPVSVQDDHIRQPLGSPTNSSQRDATLIMHVKLCRVASYILTGSCDSLPAAAFADCTIRALHCRR